MATGRSPEMQRLVDALVEARQLWDQQTDGGREAVMLALGKVYEFLDADPEISEHRLHVPLLKLAVALDDLRRGSVAPMLVPDRPSHRPLGDSWYRNVVSYAAAMMTLLMETRLGKE